MTIATVIGQVLGFTAVVAIPLRVALPFALRALASRDIFFTTVQEGTAKVVMAGDESVRILMAYKRHYLNVLGQPGYDSKRDEWDVIEGDPQKLEDNPNHYDRRWAPLRRNGVFWVGIPFLRRIHTYEHTWSEIRIITEGEDKGKEEVWTRREPTDHIVIVPFSYAFIIPEAETEDNMPVDAYAVLSVRTTNPYKALFSVDSWMQRVLSAVGRKGKNFIGSLRYRELTSETDDAETRTKDDLERDNFSHPIRDLTVKLPDDSDTDVRKGLDGRFGVAIDAADLGQIRPPKDQVEATLQVYNAEQRAEAIRVVGLAEAAADEAKKMVDVRITNLMGKAEAKSLMWRLAILRKAGDLGKLVAQLDAMSKQGENSKVIWANLPFITQHNGLSDLLEALGIKDVETLKEMIKRMADEPKTSAA